MSGAILFEDEEIQVVHRPGASDFTLVTFGELSTRPGGMHFWGRELARSLDLDAVGIVGKRENWFPTASMAKAAAPIRAASKPRSIGYGYSMGGYGVLKHAARLGLSATLAVSPQDSIAPADTPDDIRYRPYYRPELHDGMRICAEELGPFSAILADPYEETDWDHARRIQALAADRVHLLGAPLTGHSAIWLLVGTGAFRAVLEPLLAADAASMQAAIRASRARSEQWFRLMAICALRHGHVARAGRLAARAVALGLPEDILPKDEATGFEQRICSLHRRGRTEAAAAAARHLGTLRGGAFGHALRAAQHLSAMGEVAEAERLYRCAIGLGEGAAAFAGLAAVLRINGRAQEALEVLREGTAAAPEDVDLTCRLAEALLQSGRAGEAAALLRDAVMRDPRTLALRFAAARAMLASREFEPALQQARYLVQRLPEDAEAASLLGAAFSGLGRPQPALRELRRAVSLAPQEPRFRLLLSEVLRVHRGHRAAAQALREALTHSPGEPGLAARLAVLEAEAVPS